MNPQTNKWSILVNFRYHLAYFRLALAYLYRQMDPEALWWCFSLSPSLSLFLYGLTVCCLSCHWFILGLPSRIWWFTVSTWSGASWSAISLFECIFYVHKPTTVNSMVCKGVHATGMMTNGYLSWPTISVWCVCVLDIVWILHPLN